MTKKARVVIETEEYFDVDEESDDEVLAAFAEKTWEERLAMMPGDREYEINVYTVDDDV
jgi:hypothetical protein